MQIKYFKGQFKTDAEATKAVLNFGFVHYSFNLYLKNSTNEIAEIHKYGDGSASVMFGKYTKIK